MTCCCNAQKAVDAYKQRVGGAVIVSWALAFILGACVSTVWHDPPSPVCPPAEEHYR